VPVSDWCDEYLEDVQLNWGQYLQLDLADSTQLWLSPAAVLGVRAACWFAVSA
jgi:hypothetical protein